MIDSVALLMSRAEESAGIIAEAGEKFMMSSGSRCSRPELLLAQLTQPRLRLRSRPRPRP